MVKELKTLPNDEPIESQKYVVFSFVTPENVKGMTECAFMFRGAFATIEEAREHAKKLQQINGDFNIFVGEGFKWTYFNQDVNKCVDVVYREERLNEIMSVFNKQMKKKDELEKERQRDMVEEMIKDNKVKKYENDDNPDSKIKLSIKEKMEKINKMEIDKSKVNIDKIDSDIAKLKDAINKMHKE